MSKEETLVQFICTTAHEDLPSSTSDIIKNQLPTGLGTTIAGSARTGCHTLIDDHLGQGGKVS